MDSKSYNVAVTLYFKAIVVLIDLYLLKKKGKVPSNHSKRFRIFSRRLSADLSYLTLSQKKMFYYAIHGRRGENGLLQQRKGEQLGPGVLKIPLCHVQEFEEVFQKHNIAYSMMKAVFY